MEKSILVTRGTLRVPCKVTEPERKGVSRVVLGVHGIGGSASDEIQLGLAEEMGLYYGAMVRFDFPGHGDSPVDSEGFNLRNCMDSLLAAAEFAKARYPEVADLCVFATGFGAYITLLCLDELMELPGKIRLVIQTPSPLMHETLLAMAQMNEETLREKGKVTFPTVPPLTVSWDFYREMKEAVAMNSYPLPFLILHGEEDDYIPMMTIQRLRRINEDAKLVILPGIRHRFQEEGAWDMVVDLVRDWFEFEQVLLTDWE